MQELFWIDPDRLAGRCGPDTVPWDLADLKANGIDAILSVNEGTLCDPADFAEHGIAYAHIPLSPNAPPEPGDLEHNLEALPRAYDFISTQNSQGHKVVVHCRSGKDRTGLLIAYYLVRAKGISIEDAIEELIAKRPIALTAPEWMDFAPLVLKQSFGTITEFQST